MGTFKTLVLIACALLLSLNSINAISIDSSLGSILGGEYHECYRDCSSGEKMTCVYNFTVGPYTTMSQNCGDCPFNKTACFQPNCITAGGTVRLATLVNNLLPGPPIYVCENDDVIVYVKNGFNSDSTTIHFHGLHQRNTPWADGTPFITQCPILPFETFQHKFVAYPAGTHMWHGHTGVQEADGLFGQLVVRRANDSINKLYDYDLPEHTIIIWHWMSQPFAEFIQEFVLNKAPLLGYDVIINGLSSKVVYNKDGQNYTTPRAVFKVEQGKRYRFRVAFQSGLYCPLQFSVDNHTLTVIESESGIIEPVEVESFIGNAGERYDFVLNANANVDTYWIRLRSIGSLCNNEHRGVHIHQEAILQYVGSNSSEPNSVPTYDEGRRSGVLLNPIEQAFTPYPDNEVIKVSELNSSIPTLDISGTPNMTLYIESKLNAIYKIHSNQVDHFAPQMDNVTFDYTHSPLLTEWQNVPKTCNPHLQKFNCANGNCTCPYVQNITLNQLYEIVLIGADVNPMTGQDHTLHLHGHQFHVVAMETIGPNITTDMIHQMNTAGQIKKNLQNAPLKDTISVPVQGFAIIRIIPTNPGYWFFHCHFTDHSDLGMAMVLKTGEDSDMPPPPGNFPICGDFVPFSQ